MKRSLRDQHRGLRRSLEPALVEERSAAIAQALLSLPELSEAGTIGLYQALPGEVQTASLAQGLVEAGKQCLFPRVVRGSRILAFAPAADPSQLAVGALGILEPVEGDDRDLGTIELFVVPGLAFTADGGRLGQGAGYYDSTLAAAPQALRVGVCFDHQLVASLPMEVHDQHVDMVITPTQILRASRSRPR